MRVLLAEDDAVMRQFLEEGLRQLGHEVTVAADGARALQVGLAEPFDVIVLDRLLPELDGLSVLKQLRKKAIAYPVLLLTALGRIEDRVEGLEAGADDYLVKPFDLSELAARIQALARRSSATAPTTKLCVHDLEMDLLAREVRRAGKCIQLQPREFRLLEHLMRNSGEFVTRSMLLEEVWNFHFDPQTKIVETHMSRLRSKLNEGFTQDAIETSRGLGYRIKGG